MAITGIREFLNDELKIYPNPVVGNSLSVQIDGKIRSATLINMKGQSYNISYSIKADDLLQLKIPDLEPGQYILKLEMKEGIVKQKLILDQK